MDHKLRPAKAVVAVAIVLLSAMIATLELRARYMKSKLDWRVVLVGQTAKHRWSSRVWLPPGQDYFLLVAGHRLHERQLMFECEYNGKVLNMRLNTSEQHRTVLLADLSDTRGQDVFFVEDIVGYSAMFTRAANIGGIVTISVQLDKPQEGPVQIWLNWRQTLATSDQLLYTEEEK